MGIKYDEANVVASAARTATGNSGDLDTPLDVESILFLLDVTAASGTSPTLDVAIQAKNAAGNYVTMCRFAQVTAAGKRALRTRFSADPSDAPVEFAHADTGGALVNAIPIGRKYRIIWTIGGTTPSFTFTIDRIGDVRPKA